MKNASHPIYPILDWNDVMSKTTGLTKREYFTSMAMAIVMAETQEMKTASFWDWIKHLLLTNLGFSFLHVRYKVVDNVYVDAAKRAVEYADEVLKTLDSNDRDN